MTLRIRPAVLAAIFGLLAAGCGRDAPPAWLVNESVSLPRGLYLRVAARPAHGAIVAFRPPARARAYLGALGAGPEARLLKRVAAVGGQRACRTGPWLTWPGGAVRARDRDRQGRALPRWAGCVRLAPGEVLALGDTPLSFDSRYFGPVPASDLDGAYTEAWLW